jgi:hypothetical protein
MRAGYNPAFMKPNRLPKWFTHRLIPVVAILALMGGLLALDLKGHGTVWQFFWSQTGEEEPLAQIRGMVEWLGNLTRVQPRTEPLVPIQHTEVNPYGINTFLQKEVETPKIEVELQMIRDAGFHWLRQEFPWEDIEVDGRGQFTDSRNDYNGDGTPDTIDAWAKYDRIVDLVEQYSLELQVRLSNPPDWAVSNVEEVGSFAPPDDFQDFVNFAVAVATRYKGRIRYYQIWNEPNGNQEWGTGHANDPEGYTEMLCRTYAALKQVDSDIVVISAALTPTVEMSSNNLNEFIYLQRMYDAGAGECFDIMSAQGYGLFSGPTDRRMRPTTITYTRHMYIRDIMVANGDAHKPIWISEAAWNPVGEPDVPRDIVGYGNYGVVTQEQAAHYMIEAYERAQREWPWIGVINYWFFTRPDDSEKNQSFFYFRIVEPDYSPEKPTFTPLPVYKAVKDYITTQTPILYQGVHQAEDWRVKFPSNVRQVVEVDGAEFYTGIDAREVEFSAYGTDVVIRWKGDGTVSSQVNENYAGYNINFDEITTLPDIIASLEFHETVWFGEVHITETGMFEAHIGQSLLPQVFRIHLLMTSKAENGSFQLDSITVYDRTLQNLAPLVSVGIAIVGMVLWVVFSAWQERRR